MTLIKKFIYIYLRAYKAIHANLIETSIDAFDKVDQRLCICIAFVEIFRDFENAKLSSKFFDKYVFSITVAIINSEKSGNNESNPIIAMNRRSLKKKTKRILTQTIYFQLVQIWTRD